MKNIWRSLFILVSVILLWNQIVFRPFRVLSIFFHKIGHALTAFLFGYGYLAFRVTFGGMGDTILYAKGWFASFMISNGGYIGSLLFAVIVLYLRKTPARKFLLGSISILYLTISISYPALRGTLIYSVIFTSFVIVLYMIQKETINEWIIDIIGITTIAYIIYDTFVNTILLKLNQQLFIIKGWRSSPPDDIIRLSNLTHLPTLVWGIIWLVISVFVLNAVLLKASKSKKR
ncbi:MAG: M50 family metallopeptidase [Bacillota bacterium]